MTASLVLLDRDPSVDLLRGYKCLEDCRKTTVHWIRSLMLSLGLDGVKCPGIRAVGPTIRPNRTVGLVTPLSK
jgi:hypothetical protein